MATKLRKLDAENRQQLGIELGRAFTDSMEAGSARRELVQQWRRLYAGELPDKKLAWMSNVHMPFVQYMIDMAAIQIARAALSTEPAFETEALDPDYDDYSSPVENFIQYWVDRLHAKTKGWMAVKESLIAGESWLKMGVTATGQPEYPSPFVRPDQLGAVPDLDYVVFEDTMLLPFNAPSFQSAKGAFARRWLRWSEVQGLKKRGAFEQDGIDQLRERWQEGRPATQTEEQAGIGETVPRDIWNAEFECWEGIFRWTEPESEVEREWLVTAYWPSAQGGGDATILKAVEYGPIFGNQWYFIPIIVNPEPNSMHGRSMVSDTKGLNQWINATFNQATDAITMMILPPVAIGANALSKNLKWQPGEKWPIQASEAQVIQGSAATGTAIAASMGQIEFTKGMLERVTGVADPVLGQMSEAGHTKFEVGTVLEAGSQKFEWQTTIVQLGMDEGNGFAAFPQLLMEILKRYMPTTPIKYRSRKSSTGDPYEIMDPAWLQGSFQFTPTGSTGGANPQVKLQRANATMTLVTQSPFAQISPFDTPEMVLAKVQQRYKAENAFLQATGEKHPEAYIGGEPKDVEEAMALAMVINPEAVGAILTRMASVAMQESGQPALGAGMVQPGAEAGAGIGQAGAGPEVGGGGLPGAYQSPGLESLPLGPGTVG